MFRFLIVLSCAILYSCQARANNTITIDENEGTSQHSFSKTIQFPTELVLHKNPLRDPTCIWKQKIVPIFKGDEFISFRHQECETQWIKVNVVGGKIELILESKAAFGQPYQYKFQPIIYETRKIKSAKEYLAEFYTTAEEREHCQMSIVSPGVWKIQNKAYSKIPKPPPIEEDDFSALTPEEIKLERRARARKMANLTPKERELEIKKIVGKYAEHSNKHKKTHEEQYRLNRVCDKIPYTNYFFFEGDHILRMPISRIHMLDNASIKYHKK